MTTPHFTSTVPTRCIERHPTTQTVYFAGVPINMTQVARSYEPPLDVGYLSRIFNGRSTPSIAMAEKIADALGMQLQAFLDELRKHRVR
jgi:transcriptional regulator with XRE-family HTH domain